MIFFAVNEYKNVDRDPIFDEKQIPNTMTKVDPIIAVKNVEASSKWYQSVFGCKSMHGGSEFDILITADQEILLCLHAWEQHGHPTMQNREITPGNGLIIYFRTHDLKTIRQNIDDLELPVEEDVHLNPNSRRMEFSLRDPDGYYLTISDYHEYEG